MTFIHNAFAAETTPTQTNTSTLVASTSPTSPSPGASDLLSNFVPIIAIFVVFYFLVIRPQTKKHKEFQAMLSELRSGDKVVTGGGMLGVVQRIDDDGIVHVEIAPNLNIRVVKNTISSVLDKQPPANSNQPKKSNAAH
jgi:preprotein translocase subunit YajC